MRFADVDLNEEDEDMEKGEHHNAGNSDDEEEEEGDDDEFIDILDVLDGKGEVDIQSDVEDTTTTSAKHWRTGDEDDIVNDEEIQEGEEEDEDEDEDEEGEDGEDEDEDDEQLAFSPSDSEDAAPEALDELQNFISTLDPSTKKRKAPTDNEAPASSTQSRKLRRLTIKERTEAGAENEFRTQTSGTPPSMY